jgi:hypothetical protein
VGHTVEHNETERAYLAPTETTEPELHTRLIKVITTTENLIALADFMIERNIYFEKIKIEEEE